MQRNEQQEETRGPADPPTGPVDAVNRRFMRLLGDEGGPLMWVWGIFAGFSLGMTVLSAAIQMRTDAPLFHEIIMNPDVFQKYGPDRPMEANFAFLLLYPLMWIALTIYYGTLNALREVEARSGDISFSEARPLIFNRFGATAAATLVFFLAVGLGSFCCVIPGLLASFFLYLAPYLTTAHDMPIGKAISTSIDWSKRHWVLVLLLIGVSTLAALGAMAVQIISMATFHGMMGSTGILVGSLVTWSMSFFVGYFVWLYAGSILVTIGRAETRHR